MVEAVDVDFVQLQKDRTANAQARLDDLTKAESLTSATATPLVVVGRPADAIVELPKDQSAAVIVIGTHGYGPVKHLVLGNVAERVLRPAGCPVITVPYKSLATHTWQQSEAKAASA